MSQPAGDEIPTLELRDVSKAFGQVIALRSQAGYISAMGSRRAQDSRRERLLAKGVTDEELERISAPIGLDLGALTAEETALSIMAEIVAMRYGR